MRFSFQHDPKTTNWSRLCQARALFRNNMGCVLFIWELKAILTDTNEETSPQIYLSNQSSWCSILYFIILQMSRLFGTFGRSVWIFLLPAYLAMCPDASLGTVACVWDTQACQYSGCFFLSQAALPPYVLTAVTRQSSLEPQIPGPRVWVSVQECNSKNGWKS